MKIHILYDFKNQPWGGGNQFLKALKKEFREKKTYEENYQNANVVLFNGDPFGTEYLFDEIFKLKQRHPEKIIIYRLDGPVSLIRGRGKEIDKIIKLFNDLLVDGIIFQSNWCRKRNKKLFKISAKYETMIYNAPDNKIFNKNDKKEFNPKEKIKLIATSWSSNWNKGFEIYKYLDENLDFLKHEMTFVGNSPIEFKSIKWIKPISSERLAKLLSKQDVFVTASQNDPCSNSLIEALSCGLVAIVLNSGGHPELIQKGGELFSEKEEIMKKIEMVKNNYHNYQSQIPEFSIEKVAQKYYEFAQEIYNEIKSGQYQTKRVNFSTRLNFYKMRFNFFQYKLFNKLGEIKKKYV